MVGAVMSDILDSWDGVERWLAAKAKRTAAKLRPGANQAGIAAVEKAIGVQFPKALRLSFRRHDGAPDSALLPAVEDDDMGFSPLNLQQVVAEWKSQNDSADQIPDSHISADPGVRAANWRRQWI